MTTTAADTMNVLTAMMYPGLSQHSRCTCGCNDRRHAEDVVRDMVEAAYQPYLALVKGLQESSHRMAGGWDDKGTRWHQHGSQHCPCGRCSKCNRCGWKDRCHCNCCVVDADLVVHTRLGERRVVPMSIDNDRRREREITLELSEFTTRGGSPAKVRGRIVGPTEFTVPACGERDVLVVIDVDHDEGPDSDEQDEERVIDVDECVVAYADLRIGGCDNRPVRIAVSILPRDCGAYPIDCARGCC